MLTCVSRPRRFGKSYAAKMLCAYYDFSCDSHGLFDDKEIAKTEGYLRHMNQYHVISLDITGFISEAKLRLKPMADVPGNIVNAIHKELKELYPQLAFGENLLEDMIRCADETGREFVFIIDEWDALIREAKGDVEIQSAISDFREYTILNPGRFVEFTGFTENEVRSLCGKYGMDFNEIRQWYDGYDFPGCGSIYNLYSVMYAMQEQKCRSYWQKTSAAESLMTYINMDFEGSHAADHAFDQLPVFIWAGSIPEKVPVRKLLFRHCLQLRLSIPGQPPDHLVHFLSRPSLFFCLADQQMIDFREIHLIYFLIIHKLPSLIKLSVSKPEIIARSFA